MSENPVLPDCPSARQAPLGRHDRRLRQPRPLKTKGLARSNAPKNRNHRVQSAKPGQAGIKWISREATRSAQANSPKLRLGVQCLSTLSLCDFPFRGAAFAFSNCGGRLRRRTKNPIVPGAPELRIVLHAAPRSAGRRPRSHNTKNSQAIRPRTTRITGKPGLAIACSAILEENVRLLC